MYYYKVFFKNQNVFDVDELDFGKRVETVRFSPTGTSYILEDSESKILAIIPTDSVLYIQKIEEEE